MLKKFKEKRAYEKAEELHTKKNVFGHFIKDGVLQVLVEKKELEEALFTEDIIPKKFKGIKTNVLECDMPKALNVEPVLSTTYKVRTRPIQPGQSISNVGSSIPKHAGTLGLVGTIEEYHWNGIRLPNRVGRMLSAKLLMKMGVTITQHKVGITNKHVAGDVGDRVVQPGTLDGGVRSRDSIGDVIMSGRFDVKNPLDIAVIKLTEDAQYHPINMLDVRRKGIEILKDIQRHYHVKKSGRSSAVTYGTVRNPRVNITVDMGGSIGKIRFPNMIEIDADRDGTPLLIPGDSGSSVWVSPNQCIGIGFAAGSRFSYVIPIDAIQKETGVML